MNWIILTLKLFVLTILLLTPPTTNAQQNYSGIPATECKETPSAPPLYTCNGDHNSCTSFLLFTAKFPFNSVPAIAALTSTDQSLISKLNNVTGFTVFPEDQQVIVPVNCSCSKEYYKATTFYQVVSDFETYRTIANDTFQGLSTCSGLMNANPNHNLKRGDDLGVPLRCACPTREQSVLGTKYLLTYPIVSGDTLYQLGKQFNVSTGMIAEANGLEEELSTIYSSTTILIPLPGQPSGLHTARRGDIMPVPPPLPAPIVLKLKSSKVLSIAGITSGALSAIILMVLILAFLVHKRGMHVTCAKGRDFELASPRRELIKEIARLHCNLKVFKLSEIKRATGNFASRNRLNRRVYRGIVKRGVFAIKKCDRDAADEVKMLQQINHFNIVKLHGFCEHEDNLYLVYEYMENGSLHDWIAGGGSEHLRSWSQLIRIALDAASGLLYLHKFMNLVHVHNNVSSSNILLDKNLRAKIANFSLARTENSTCIKRVVATKGYVAPECLEAGQITPKVDVFAFGVVLLELITGKEAVFVQDCRERLLSTTIAAVIESQGVEIGLSQFIDSNLSENGGMAHAVQSAKLSLSCLAQDASDRPDMIEVVAILQKLQFNVQKPAQKMIHVEKEDTFSFSSVLQSI